VHNVDSMELMGPLLDRLAHHLKLTPRREPGLFRQLVDAKSRTIEAVRVCVPHDDGARADDLNRAEAVLVGISRTMKTPTRLYAGLSRLVRRKRADRPEAEACRHRFSRCPRNGFSASI